MAVKLRLTRRGKNKQPLYRLVATDRQSPRDGKFLEVLGFYNPRTKPPVVKIKEDRLKYWLEKGAIPSETVRKLVGKLSAKGGGGGAAAA